MTNSVFYTHVINHQKPVDYLFIRKQSKGKAETLENAYHLKFYYFFRADLKK